jgi:uncharacterized DUF497 family protein
MTQPFSFRDTVGFEWDKANILKNWEKHRVSHIECEEVFFSQPLVTGADEPHSERETRYYALGETDDRRRLFIVFTVRGDRIRVISARDMSRKERQAYEKAKEASAVQE